MATMMSSVRMRAEKDMAMMLMNSTSNRSRAPNMITLPKNNNNKIKFKYALRQQFNSEKGYFYITNTNYFGRFNPINIFFYRFGG